MLSEEFKLKLQENYLAVVQYFGRMPRWQSTVLLVCLLGAAPAYFGLRLGAQVYWNSRYKNYLLAAKPSFTSPRPVKAPAVTVLSTGNSTYAAYAQISNENLDLSVQNLGYKFDFFNAAGELVASDSGSIFLLPNQTKYVLAPRVESRDAIVKAGLSFSPAAWQKRLQIPEVALQTSLPQVSDSLAPQALVVSGSVLNNSPFSLAKVRLVFLLYNASGKIFALSQRDEFTFKAFERRDFNQLWPGLSSQNAARAVILAETNVLDNSNLGLEAANSGGGSSLDRPGAKSPFGR